jgi:hypothetical protein
MLSSHSLKCFRSVVVVVLVLTLGACNSSSEPKALSDIGSITGTESTSSGGTDTGSGGTDTGSGGTDTGSGGTDTGSGGTDTGSGGTDTGSGGTDTGSGVATLTWDMPIQRVDGSDLKPVEIATYRIYHGTSPADLKLVAQTEDGQTTTYQVTGLEAGTHYFYVTAVDLNYLESPPSETKQKTF